MIKAITVLSKQKAQAYVPGEHEAIISITNHDEALATLQPGWAQVLRVQFTDFGNPSPLRNKGIDTIPQVDRHRFSYNHACAIVEFIAQIESTTTTEHLVVHCLAGYSRSAAVATWLAHRNGLTIPIAWVGHNRRVLKMLAQHEALQQIPQQPLWDGIQNRQWDSKAVIRQDRWAIPPLQHEASLIA